MHPTLHGLFDKHRVEVEHPLEARAEAEARAAEPGIDDPALIDLTHLAFCTIDEESSRDLDQALFIEQAGEGLVAWYALADASWFVRPGSALWDEALRRGASYYLPGLVAPMLPRVLSEDLCSLNPGVDRRALVFRVVLDQAGRVVTSRILRARVHSRAKLSYDGVQAWLDGGERPCADPEVLASLRRLCTFGQRRLALAEERDVVRFRRCEVSVHVRQDGESDRLAFVAFTDRRLDIERYNEQLSLLCNQEGARFLRAETDPELVQPIYRVHDPPQDQRLAALQARLDGLLAAQGLGEDWRWRRGQESLADYLARLPEGRLARAVHRQAMMSSGRASFTDRAGVHHGVGADLYARFTAPMREIVGVFLHEEALERLAGRPMPAPEGVPDDHALREQVIAAANRCHQVQKALDRDANRLVLDQLFAQDLRSGAPPRRRGTVMGFDRRKVHVQLDEPAIDLKLYLHHLEERAGVRLRLAEDGCSVGPTRGEGPVLALGDAVDVWVEGEDPSADRWRLACERVAEPGEA